MTEDQVIEKYVESHPDMTEDDIASYATKLQKEYGLDLRLLRRLIRVETRRTKKAMVYDLDYDVQLNEAIKIIREEKFSSLVRSTKTLKQLQQEAEDEEAKKQELEPSVKKD